MFNKFLKGQKKEAEKDQKFLEDNSPKFIEDYNNLCKEHGIQIAATLNIGKYGIQPNLETIIYKKDVKA